MSTPLFHFPPDYAQVVQLSKLDQVLLDPFLSSLRLAHG